MVVETNFNDSKVYKLSVIIPTYNSEKYLEDTMKSLINQTFCFEDIEIIIIDDNSLDNTKEIIGNLSKKYSNVMPIFLNENSGSPSKPRNVGIKNASSKYVMFLDADDKYCLDFCEKMYSTIEDYSADIITCRNYDEINGELTKYHSILDKKDILVELGSIDKDDSLLSTTAMLIWNKIYRKDFLLKNNIKFNEGTFYEDVYFNLQAYMDASHIVYLNDYYGYIYNIRKGDNKSASNDFNEKNLLKFYNGLKNIFNLLESKNKYYKKFESEMLIGFLKWVFLTNCDVKLKLGMFNTFKKYYKRYNLFVRLEHIPLIQNIFINLGIKFILLNDSFFVLLSKLISNVYNK